jgi:thiamine biosynthesis lipoprotein
LAKAGRRFGWQAAASLGPQALPTFALGATVGKPSAQRPAPSAQFEFTQIHMGLPVRLVLHAPDRETAESAARDAFARIAVLDRMMSDYRPDSELRAIERARGPVRVSPELMAVLRRAVAIADATGGAFDPTVGPLVALWREARTARRLPEPAALEAARRRTGWRHLDLDPHASTVRLRLDGMRLDLGGIAKGYILQETLQILRSRGVTRALVESGGDIVAGDAPPDRAGWRIDVRGADPEFAARAAQLANAALSTSGASAQFVEFGGVRYSHVIDPRTGLGSTGGITAHVIAPDAATADALSTALTVLGPEAAGMLRAGFPDAIWAFTR